MTHKNRIQRLKEGLEPLAGGKVDAWISDSLPPEAAEQFCRDVMAFETAPTTTNFKQLTETGVALPNPDDVADEAMPSTLWAVIHGLEKLRVFLNWTDHLSDRELYEVLWKDILREDMPLLPKSSQGVWHVDLPGGDPDCRQYLKYYADEEDRGRWQKEFPDYDMPAHEDPPYDRDRLLPVPRDPDDGGETRN